MLRHLLQTLTFVNHMLASAGHNGLVDTKPSIPLILDLKTVLHLHDQLVRACRRVITWTTMLMGAASNLFPHLHDSLAVGHQCPAHSPFTGGVCVAYSIGSHPPNFQNQEEGK